MTDQAPHGEEMTPETCPACGSDEAATRGVMMDWPTKGQGGVPCSHPWHAAATPPLPVREPSGYFGTSVRVTTGENTRPASPLDPAFEARLANFVTRTASAEALLREPHPVDELLGIVAAAPVREPPQAFEQMKSDVAKIFASSEASGAERKAAWDQIVALCAAPVQEFRDQCCRVSRISEGHVRIEVLVDNVVDLTIVQNRTLMFRRADLPLVHVAAQLSAADASAVTREAIDAARTTPPEGRPK